MTNLELKQLKMYTKIINPIIITYSGAHAVHDLGGCG